MRNVILCLFALLVHVIVITAQDTAQRTEPGRINKPEQEEKPYVILISSDGFRYDYAGKYHATHLLALSAQGVKAESMQPSFPSVTFPNHYTIATGLYPAHHGLVYNQFYDRSLKATYDMSDRKAVDDGSWYGGIPLWVLAEQQGMLSASYFFVGSEANVDDVRPTYWYRFNDKTDIDFRIKKVVEWLELPPGKRPHLITFYIGNADHAGHEYGPNAPETQAAVHFVDEAIGKMVAEVSKLGLPVNYIFLADHGMTNVDTLHGIDLSSLVDTSKFIIRGGGTSKHIYARDTSYIKDEYNLLLNNAVDYDVYLRKDIPSRWHYSLSDDRFGRIGDIFLVPHYPMVFSRAGKRIDPGAHGFDPAMKDMHAVFIAWGPAFKKGLTIPTFENVNVYPLACKILGLTYSHKIDGNLQVLEHILK